MSSRVILTSCFANSTTAWANRRRVVAWNDGGHRRDWAGVIAEHPADQERRLSDHLVVLVLCAGKRTRRRQWADAFLRRKRRNRGPGDQSREIKSIAGQRRLGWVLHHRAARIDRGALDLGGRNAGEERRRLLLSETESGHGQHDSTSQQPMPTAHAILPPEGFANLISSTMNHRQ